VFEAKRHEKKKTEIYGKTSMRESKIDMSGIDNIIKVDLRQNLNGLFYFCIQNSREIY